MTRRTHAVVVLVALAATMTTVIGRAPARAQVASAVIPPAPLGANNWSCRPSAVHPRPVVLVHGTLLGMDFTWQALSPLLTVDGYCVFALDYGGVPGSPVQGTAPIEDSALQLRAFVDRVLAATGTSTVDLVGHSQGGGVLPRYYLGALGGMTKVHSLIGLAPSNHGTDVSGVVELLELVNGGPAAAFGPWCQACLQQLRGSPFLTELNAGGDTVPGVDYTVIATRDDEIVTPYESQFLHGPAVHKITVQDQCPVDSVDHLGLAYDSVALQDVERALDPAHAPPVICPVLPVPVGNRRAR